VGTYRTLIDANRTAVRALGAAHKCPELGSFALGLRSRGSEGRELPFPVEPPVE